jgi:hypothetical protein
VKLLLAVGHGIRSDGVFDPGATSADGRLDEQRAGDIIVAEAARVLRGMGATVRDEAFKADPNFGGSIVAANSWPADYAVEIHHDWAGAPEGAFAHWYSPAGKALADDIQAAVGAAGFPLRPDWHKFRSDLSFIKKTNMPSVLYECGRIGQGSLDTPVELMAMGRAIAAGIAKHVGLNQAPLPQEVPDMTPDEVRAIVRAEIDIISAPGPVAAAQQKLIDAGLLSGPRPSGKAASTDLVMLLAARLLDQVGVVDLTGYELQLVKK